MDEGRIEVDSEGTQQAWPLCTNCMTPCDPRLYYCPNCDSNEPINPLVPYISFVNIRFNTGIFIKLWRKCWYEEGVSVAARCFYLFMLLLFSPLMVVVGIPFLLVGKIRDEKIRNLAEIGLTIFFGLAVLLFVLMVVI